MGGVVSDIAGIYRDDKARNGVVLTFETRVNERATQTNIHGALTLGPILLNLSDSKG
jgi:hypothetical protein